MIADGTGTDVLLIAEQDALAEKDLLDRLRLCELGLEDDRLRKDACVEDASCGLTAVSATAAW